MTEANFPQCRIVTGRLLRPETVETFLNKIVGVPGIRRMILNGPSIPKTVPYGPARGSPNPHSDRRSIQVGSDEVELRVQVGTILLELEDQSPIEKITKACDEVFAHLSYNLKEGKFMRSTPTQTDYAKYGPNADPLILGIVDPKNKIGPEILQGTK